MESAIFHSRRPEKDSYYIERYFGMIKIEGTTLRQLQMVELEMLIELDRICRKCGIRYTLTGGTLLGAVRHGGFIPWDDDADVSMMREEYEKFRKACETELDKERFYFQDMRNTAGYRWGYGKMRRKDTLFLREYQQDMPYKQGVFIDIFPRDGVPDGRIGEKLHKFACFCVRKTLWSPVGKKAHPNIFMRKWFAILYRLSGTVIYKIYDYLVKVSNKKETQYVRALTFPVPNGYKGYKREWYAESVNIEFEGHTFMANRHYREWLEQEFGDYMKLPPEVQRKVHPVVDIRLIEPQIL